MGAKQKKLSQLDTGLACQQKGDLDGAEAAFRAVLDADPDHPDALVLLGTLLQKTKRPKEGVELIEQAIGVAPKRGRAPDPAWRVALSFAKRDAGDGALAEIENLISTSPRHPELLFMKADLLRAGNRHESAIETLKKLLEIKPQHEKAWNNLGISLRARGLKTEAFHAFLKVVELQPDHSQAANNASQILSEVDDPVGTIKRLQSIIEPAFDDGNAQLAVIDVLLVAGFSDQAESIALKALKRHP
jgi:tetratricopeptide (TPR) repeat protein